MKVRFLVTIAILAQFLYVFYYVYGTATDIVFRDDMYLIKGGFIESYCNGTLSFSDLWRPTAANRILGYSMLQLASIKWFEMNNRLIVILIPFLMLISSLLIFHNYQRSFLPERSPQFIAVTFFFLNLILFNLIQWEGLTFAYGFVFQAPTPIFIANFIALEVFIASGQWKYWPVTVVLSILAVLVFGGTQSFAFGLALGATFICYVVTHRKNLPAGFWGRSLLASVFLALMAFIYLYEIDKNDYFPGSLPAIGPLLAQPAEVVQFVFAAFGSSVVGINAANAYFSFHSMVALGFIVLLIYAIALILFFKKRMYDRSYLPFYLIMLTFFYLGIMTVGRFGYGMNYGMASRYTCVSLYGIIAISWIFIFILSVPPLLKRKWRILSFLSLLLILAGVLVTAIVEWRIQPYRKAYFDQLQHIALKIDSATPSELSKFEERPDLVRDSLRLLREHKLNVYRKSSIQIFDGSDSCRLFNADVNGQIPIQDVCEFSWVQRQSPKHAGPRMSSVGS